MTEKENCIYLAGFFDGEGYIGLTKRIRRGKYLEYTVRISIGQNDGATLDWIKDNFGGGIFPIKRDGSFSWIATNQAAYGVLKKILPYLKYKKPQAKVAIRYFTEQLPRKQALSEKEFERRAEIYDELKRLKHILTESSHYNVRVQRLNESAPKGDVIV